MTLVSLPIYAGLYHWHGAMGLAVASNLGILLQTGSLAVLLHQRRMVSLASIDVAELGRCAAAGVVSGAAVWAAVAYATRLLPTQTRLLDVGELSWARRCGC